MLLYVSSTCAHHQEVKIALHSLWYHQTYRWPSGAQVEGGLQSSLNLRTGRPPIAPIFVTVKTTHGSTTEVLLTFC